MQITINLNANQYKIEGTQQNLVTAEVQVCLNPFVHVIGMRVKKHGMGGAVAAAIAGAGNYIYFHTRVTDAVKSVLFYARL